jgi:hypothetical protein
LFAQIQMASAGDDGPISLCNAQTTKAGSKMRIERSIDVLRARSARRLTEYVGAKDMKRE